MRPSRSNRSLNDDFVITSNLHYGADELSQITNADFVGVHAFSRNVDAAHDELLSVLLDLSHDEQGCAARRDFDRGDFALARLRR